MKVVVEVALAAAGNTEATFRVVDPGVRSVERKLVVAGGLLARSNRVDCLGARNANRPPHAVAYVSLVGGLVRNDCRGVVIHDSGVVSAVTTLDVLL